MHTVTRTFLTAAFISGIALIAAGCANHNRQNAPASPSNPSHESRSNDSMTNQSASPETSTLRQNLSWQQLPPVPDEFGYAAPFAGVSGGALIVGGGANFPNGMIWDGGKKAWHDSVFVLPEPKGKWLTGFKLPQPIAYGVSVTTPDGVLCAGGGDAAQNTRDVFLLQWQDNQLKTKSLPPLPKTLANSCGAIMGSVVYLAGGIETPDATHAMKNFWSLDLAAATPAWQELPAWPGPARMLAIAGVHHGTFYLFSGTDLNPDANGKPARTYLSDAYAYKPCTGWKKLSDLPRSAVAAPSPAITFKNHLLVVTGDDGKLVTFEPKSKHPGFPKDVLAYDPARDQWTQLPESPLSRATAPVVEWHHRAVIVNGEARPGVRTPQVWELDLH